ncbi:MAG: hypothetical protein JW778_02290 [Candidatus Altiarchaeota archaeon]|nr:hypothetical protein [Candidatus Altiarchaeota archaeon]
MSFKEFLKPTKNKIKFFTVILAANLILYPDILYHIYRFLKFGVPYQLPMYSHQMTTFTYFGWPFIIPNLPVILVILLLATVNIGGVVILSILFLIYWWFIASLLSRSFFDRRGFRNIVRILAGLFILVFILNSVFVFSAFGWESDRGCYGLGRIYEVRNFSSIGFGDVLLCDAIDTTLNAAGTPITLKSIKVIDNEGNSCSRKFDKPLKLGESTKVVLRQNCPDWFEEEEFTVEVTYIQKINGEETLIRETGSFRRTMMAIIS